MPFIEVMGLATRLVMGCKTTLCGPNYMKQYSAQKEEVCQCCVKAQIRAGFHFNSSLSTFQRQLELL